MKLAVLSDIHGNSYALEQVLKDVKKAGVEKLLVLGDIVGYYYYPDKVIELLENLPYEIIKGNHEKILQDLEEEKLDPAKLLQKYGRGHFIALDKLSSETRSWLYSLPFHKSLEIDNLKFQMNHGSPWDYNEYLYPDTDSVILSRCNSVAHDFIFIGHSHYSFTYQCRDSVLINVGSVGQSRKKGGVAEWTLIDSFTRDYKMVKTHYDVTALYKDAEDIDPGVKYNSKILVR